MDTRAEWINYRRPAIWGHCGGNATQSLLQLYWGWFFPMCFGIVQIDRPRRVGTHQWRWKVWSPAGYRPTYYVYKDGVLFSVQRSGTIDVHAEWGEKVSLEVLDDPNATPDTTAVSSRVVLEWPYATNARQYRVEEYIDSTWTARTTFPADGRPRYRWQSRPLPDAADHLFRVVAVGPAGNEDVSSTVTKVMGRPPDAPQTKMTYADASHKLTIRAEYV